MPNLEGPGKTPAKQFLRTRGTTVPGDTEERYSGVQVWGGHSAQPRRGLLHEIGATHLPLFAG